MGSGNMNEWTVVTVIIALVGLVVTVAAPVIKLNTSITKLTVAMENLQKAQDRLAVENTDSHRRLWVKNDEQDAKINDHETRMHVVEGKLR